MAYADFTLEEVGRSLKVTTRDADLSPGRAAVAIPPRLAETLGRQTQLAPLG